MNCIHEGIIPNRYFGNTVQSLTAAGGGKLKINYKLSDVLICNTDNKTHLTTTFLLVKNLQHKVILGTPFKI